MSPFSFGNLKGNVRATVDCSCYETDANAWCQDDLPNVQGEVEELEKSLKSLKASIAQKRELGLIGKLEDDEDLTSWRRGSDRVFSSKIEDDVQGYGYLA